MQPDVTWNLVIIHHIPLLSEGISGIVSKCPDLHLVGTGKTAADAITMADRHKPHVLVLDPFAVGGLKAIRDMKAAGVEARILVLTRSESGADVEEALRSGAQGYVLETASGMELVQAIRAVCSGQNYLTPNLGARLLSGRSNKTEVQLSAREREILGLLAAGYNNRGIAAQLTLSEKTVKHYLTKLFKTYNVGSRLELALAIRATPPS